MFLCQLQWCFMESMNINRVNHMSTDERYQYLRAVKREMATRNLKLDSNEEDPEDVPVPVSKRFHGKYQQTRIPQTFKL